MYIYIMITIIVIIIMIIIVYIYIHYMFPSIIIMKVFIFLKKKNIRLSNNKLIQFIHKSDQQFLDYQKLKYPTSSKRQGTFGVC